MEALGDQAPKIARFIGGVSKDAAEVAHEYKWSNMTDDFFSSDKGSRVVRQTLFKDGAIPDNVIFSRLGGSGDMPEKGVEILARNIKLEANPQFDELIKMVAPELSQETLETIKRNDIKSLIISSNHQKQTEMARGISTQIESAVQSKLDELGSAIIRGERDAIERGGKLAFTVNDLGVQLEKQVRAISNTVKVPNSINQPGVQFRGRDDLLEMVGMFKRTVAEGAEAGKRKFIGDDGLGVITKRQAVKLNRQLDIKADEIFNNKHISGDVKAIARDFMQKWRSRYYGAEHGVAVSDQKAAFSAFKSLADEIKISRSSGVDAMERRINNWRNTGSTDRTELQAVLNELKSGKKIQESIERFSAGKDLSRLNIQKILGSFETMLNDPHWIQARGGQYGKAEIAKLANIDHALGNSRKFVDDSRMFQSAQGFQRASQSLLRVQAVAGILGLGTGLMAGTPTGLATGLGSVMLLTPQNIGKAMRAMERRSASRIARSTVAQRRLDTYGSTLLTQLLKLKAASGVQ
jgi:hypothetical protein